MMNPESRLDAHKVLHSAREALLRKRRLEEQLATAEAALEDENGRVRDLARTCERESADVKRLTGLSVVGLFTSLLGSKEMRLSKERQELAAASLKLDAGRQVAARLETERDRIADELAGFHGAEAEYTQALTLKESLLREDGELGRNIAALANEEAATGERLRELDEALAAGREAASDLEQVVASLDSAQGWGMWDLLGGGFIATAIKHSKLDDAKSLAIGAQSSLRRFERELGDLGETLAAGIEIGGFSRFADYFFDGLIMDWIVQSRISDARDEARSALSQVQSLARRLEDERSRCAQEEASLGLRRRALVEES